jgi:hypothetical protein
MSNRPAPATPIGRTMPQGRHPEGEHALSDAERQARSPAHEAHQAAPIIRYRRPANQRTRVR